MPPPGPGLLPCPKSLIKPQDSNRIPLPAALLECTQDRYAQVTAQLVWRAERGIDEIKHKGLGKTNRSGQQQRKKSNPQRGPFGNRGNDRLLSHSDIQD